MKGPLPGNPRSYYDRGPSRTETMTGRYVAASHSLVILARRVVCPLDKSVEICNRISLRAATTGPLALRCLDLRKKPRLPEL